MIKGKLIFRKLIKIYGGQEMNHTCYHCQHDTQNAHLVTFYNDQDEQNELLCDACYDEWLQSLKG
jgi:hypothetical protein